MNRILILLLCLAPAALPQEKTIACDPQESHWGKRGQYCEVREVTIPAGSRLDVDSGPNGGIAVKGADRGDILVRSKVQANQDDEDASRRVAQQIRVETAGGRIRAVGPSESGHHGWSVSFEILVPRQIDLALRTENGGIHISEVAGKIGFETVNGGVHLDGLAGAVEGHTTNGGVHLALGSDHWEGSQCDVYTTNGGVTILVPERYSAHLETGTENGGLDFGFPVTVQGEMRKHVAVDLGSGGNLVRAVTTNGGVSVQHSSTRG